MKLNRLLRSAAMICLISLMALSLAACGEEEVDVDKIIDEATEQVAAGGDDINACAIVTQQDASDLFGEQATEDVADAPLVLGECIWTWDTDTANQLLQFRVYDGEEYYYEDADAEPLDVGEKGSIRVHEVAGIDIQWIQDGKTVSLNYSNVGEGVPDVQTKVEAMKALAEKVSGKL